MGSLLRIIDLGNLGMCAPASQVAGDYCGGSKYYLSQWTNGVYGRGCGVAHAARSYLWKENLLSRLLLG